MRIAGQIILIRRTMDRLGNLFRRTNCAGICLAVLSAVGASRKNSSSSPTTRASDSISQARRAQTASLRLLSAPGTLALFAAPDSTPAESVSKVAAETSNYTTRAYRFPLPALPLHPQRRIGRYSRLT